MYGIKAIIKGKSAYDVFKLLWGMLPEEGEPGDEYMFDIEGVSLYKGVVKEVTGIPNKREGVMYIVSLFVVQCVKRDDLIAPDTHRAIRDEQGRIVAVRGWRR